MGGVLILAAITVSTLLWADLSNRFVWFALVVTLAFGAVGFADDYIKIKNKDPKGLTARKKYIWLSLVGFSVATLIDRKRVVARTSMTVGVDRGGGCSRK